jgi:hypothetical protein
MDAPLVAVGNRNSFSKFVTHRVIVHVHVGVLCSSVDGVGRIDSRGNVLVDSLDFAQGNRILVEQSVLEGALAAFGNRDPTEEICA